MRGFGAIAAACAAAALLVDFGVYAATKRAVHSVLRANLEAPAREKLPQVMESMRVGLSPGGRAVLAPYLQGCLNGFGALYAAALGPDGAPLAATADYPGGAADADGLTTRERSLGGLPVLELRIPVSESDGSPRRLGTLVLGFSLGETIALERRIAVRATALSALASAAALSALLVVVWRGAEAIRRGEQRLRQSEKMSAIGQLSAGIAHEINNPLGTILGFAQAALARPEVPAPLEGAFRAIEEESRRCRRLVQDLLAFSRRDGEDLSRFDLAEAAEGALALLAARARLQGVAVETDWETGLFVRARRSQIQQVVINLVSNALDAMPQGGRLRLTARRGALAGRPAAVLAVADSGPGIPAEHLARVFEPFFTTKESGKGTGLGLAIVEEIVRHHHGEIIASAAAEGGASFSVRLPLDA